MVAYSDAVSMSLANSLTKMPRAFNPERGAEAITYVPELKGVMRELAYGVAGCSPYLFDLIKHEAAWLPEALTEPEAALAAILAPPKFR